MTGRNSSRGGRTSSADEQAASLKNGQHWSKINLGDVVWIRIENRTWWPALIVDEESTGFKDKNKKLKKGKDEVLVRLYGTYEHLYADPAKCNSDFEQHIEQENTTVREVFLKSLKGEISSMLDGKSQNKASEDADSSARQDLTKVSKREKTKQDERNPEASFTCSTNTPKDTNRKTVEMVQALQAFQSNSFKKRKAEKQGHNKENAGTGNSKKNKDKIAQLKRKTSEAENFEQTPVRKQAVGKGKNSVEITPKKQVGSRNTETKDMKKHAEKDNGFMIVNGVEGGSTDLSARRVRIMQSLGLIAPAGSPFQRKGFARTGLIDL